MGLHFILNIEDLYFTEWSYLRGGLIFRGGQGLIARLYWDFNLLVLLRGSISLCTEYKWSYNFTVLNVNGLITVKLVLSDCVWAKKSGLCIDVALLKVVILRHLLGR